MKNLQSLSLIVLSALFLFYWSACEQADTVPPTIVVVSPEDDASIEAGEKLCVQVTFTDNKALSAYKLNIHPNFNGHSHAPMRQENPSRAASEESKTVDFEITLTSASQNDPLTGTNCFRDIDIDIPANATPGNYHLLIYCTDAAGNEMYVAQDLKIVQP